MSSTSGETTADPRALLMAAHRVLESNESAFDGCREVTVAALTRQAVEVALEARLQSLGVGRVSKKAAFLCLAAASDNPDDVRILHHTWSQLSDACHGTSYELPPNHRDLERWIKITAGFIGR